MIREFLITTFKIHQQSRAEMFSVLMWLITEVPDTGYSNPVKTLQDTPT